MKNAVIAGISIGVIIVLVLGGILLSMPVNETYQKKETYTVKEPYQVEVEKKLNYKVLEAKSGNSFSGFNVVTNAWIELENRDTVPGTFIVECNIRTLERTLKDRDRIYVEPGDSKKAECQVDTDLGEDTDVTYDVKPDTKTVTETRFRDVDKTRYVTKTREISLYQKLLS